jgi:hypothetical protein
MRRESLRARLSKGRVPAAPLHRILTSCPVIGFGESLDILRLYSMLNAFSFKQFNIVQSRCAFAKPVSHRKLSFHHSLNGQRALYSSGTLRHNYRKLWLYSPNPPYPLYCFPYFAPVYQCPKRVAFRRLQFPTPTSNASS